MRACVCVCVRVCVCMSMLCVSIHVCVCVCGCGGGGGGGVNTGMWVCTYMQSVGVENKPGKSTSVKEFSCYLWQW